MTTIATVSPSELIRSTWGNSVATELNSNTVKIAGSAMTGSLIINATPALKLRRSDNNPYLQFESTTGTRYSFIQGQGATVLKYNVDSASGYHSLEVADSERLRVDNTGVDVTGTFSVAGVSSFNTTVKIGSNGNQLHLVDTSTAGSDFHDVTLSFYGAGVSMVSPGVRTGLIGYGGATTLELRNEVTNGPVLISTTGTGAITLDADTIVFTTAAERGRITGSDLLWGKTASNIATVGTQLHANGTITSTAGSGAVSLYARHSVDLNGSAFVQFANAAGGILSEIFQDAVAPVGIGISNCAVTAPSDYRLKNDLGPVVAAVDRTLQLQPKHLQWKAGGDPFDGFLAHEVAAVIPEAVTGETDATYDAAEAERYGVQPGDIKPQQLDQIPLIPLLTAAIQELAGRVDALEGAG
jgi:hypothetical protein